MKTTLSILALGLLLAGAANAATTKIATVPVLNSSGTGAVKPNLMLLYDNSGSMAWSFTPDYVDDATTCRTGASMASGQTGCAPGHPPYNSPDFNKQSYNPRVTYKPPVKADGTSFPSQDRTTTSIWSAVTTDGFGVNTVDLVGSQSTSTNLTNGFPDLKWCDTNKSNATCVLNAAAYNYPDATYANAKRIYTNPYYYSINVAEYCTDASLTTCLPVAVGAPAPTGYPVAAKLRWCNSTALTDCQAKFVGNYKYPRYSAASAAAAVAYGTIGIDASARSQSIEITSVSVSDPAGTVVITNGSVSAPNGTNSGTKQATMATALAASIVAKSGLATQYTACVKTPTPAGSTVPTCASYGITLGGDNIVAVIPIDCAAGATGKSLAQCPVSPASARSGWALTVTSPVTQVEAAQPATAILGISGTTDNLQAAVLSGMSLGDSALFPSGTSLSFAASTSATAMAAAIRNRIATIGTVTAHVGGTPAISTACSNASTASVCLVNTATNAGGQAISMGSLSNAGSIAFALSPSTVATAAVYDTVPTRVTPLGGGNAVFVRTDIVPTTTSYPRDPNRSDCSGATTCTYDEEMTNFANWYGYYRTRNQMMKTAVGQAFQPISDNYKVGLVSLSVAAAQGAMNLPKPFSGTDRATWYSQLYAMQTSGATPLRQALHAVGKMYANLPPYELANDAAVVQFPCQQNFTFMTTDGYWNGEAAADVGNNDNTENANRFCTRAKGCVDTRATTPNSLADVALYWYNGGSNSTGASLRTTLEDWSKPAGLVPAAAGDNTRLHMNTYALGLGVDGIMNYEPAYDTAPMVGGDFHKLITGVTTGCPWNNKGAYVWPDPLADKTSGSAAYQSRVDDLWHAAINGHGKYFSASDPRQVIEGLRSALSNIEVKTGAAAAAATSTPNISQQDNDIFSDTFTTVKWYGELSNKKIDTVTGVVSSTAVWNSSDQLGRKVAAASDSRVIKMLDVATGGLKDFKYGDAFTALEKSWFDNKCLALGQCASLSVANRAIVNAGANIVDWLRGQQQYANDTVLRAYSLTTHNPPGLSAPIPIVLGDIASSKPAFVREPRKGYSIAGYSDFRDANKNRGATVFAAANDGMLHAFNAATGVEMWAYAPRITMHKLHLQASTTYGTNHQFSADGSPEVADVQMGSPLAWKTVLVAGLNGGGRGYYALDVTDPANPVAMWELCADPAVCASPNNDADLGLSFGNPQFGMWKDQWVVFLTSGYNNVPGTDGVAGGSGGGFLYVVDIASGRILDKIPTGAGSTGTPSGFAKITAVSSDPQTDPLITHVYGGDNQGKMWRFDLTDPALHNVVTMGDAGELQPITTRPEVTTCRVDSAGTGGTVTATARKVVVFGTGRLLDGSDVANTDRQSLYVLKDADTGIASTAWRTAASMAKQTLAKLPGTSSYTVSGPGVDLSTQAGWYLDFDQNAGERVNLDPKVVAGGLNVVTNLPSSSSACSVGGTSNVYQLNVCTGKPILSTKVVTEPTTPGGTQTVTDVMIAGGTLSNTSAAVGFIIIRLPSGALKMVTTTADGGNITSTVTPAITLGARKAGWRRIRN